MRPVQAQSLSDRFRYFRNLPDLLCPCQHHDKMRLRADTIGEIGVPSCPRMSAFGAPDD